MSKNKLKSRSNFYTIALIYLNTKIWVRINWSIFIFRAYSNYGELEIPHSIKIASIRKYLLLEFYLKEKNKIYPEFSVPNTRDPLASNFVQCQFITLLFNRSKNFQILSDIFWPLKISHLYPAMPESILTSIWDIIWAKLGHLTTRSLVPHWPQIFSCYMISDTYYNISWSIRVISCCSLISTGAWIVTWREVCCFPIPI